MVQNTKIFEMYVLYLLLLPKVWKKNWMWINRIFNECSVKGSCSKFDPNDKSYVTHDISQNHGKIKDVEMSVQTIDSCNTHMSSTDNC